MCFSYPALICIDHFQFKLQAILYDICSNRKFDMAIMGFIGLNMVTMMLDEYKMSKLRGQILDYVNQVFIVIFTAECVLKVLAFRWYYFKEPWNLFDFIVVTLSILGKLCERGQDSQSPSHLR